LKSVEFPAVEEPTLRAAEVDVSTDVFVSAEADPALEPTVESVPIRLPALPDEVVFVPDEPAVEPVPPIVVVDFALLLPVPPEVVEEDALLLPVPPDLAEPEPLLLVPPELALDPLLPPVPLVAKAGSARAVPKRTAIVSFPRCFIAVSLLRYDFKQGQRASVLLIPYKIKNPPSGGFFEFFNQLTSGGCRVFL
jgi:hypothetical protein